MLITNVVSPPNLVTIREAGQELLDFVKKNKVFTTSEFRGDVRIKSSDCLLVVYRALNGDRFDSITGDKTPIFAALVERLSSLLGDNTAMMTMNIGQYAKDITPRLARETVCHLDSLYVMGQIDINTISYIYECMNKPVPRKFDKVDDSNIVYASLSVAIADESHKIKADMVVHYSDMVARVGDIDNKKEFAKKALTLMDMQTAAMCVAFRFDDERFMSHVNDAFDMMVRAASSKIADAAPEGPDVVINSVKVGNKGFDVNATVNGKNLYARAIPVEGCFVRFHYRYIIS